MLPEIEKAVQTRDLPTVRRLLGRFLRGRGNDLEACFQASEFYRRISDLPSALRVLRIESDTRFGPTLDRVEIRHQLQGARILNLLGSSARALRMLTLLPKAVLLENWKQVGGILVSNFRYDDAFTFYRRLEDLRDSELGYDESLSSVSLADCFFGRGDFGSAYAILERILALRPEPLLRGIANQALGSYCLLRGDLKRGGRFLAEAQRQFPETDNTADRGYLDKWLGALAALQGNLSGARQHLDKAWRILYRPGFKPETWLEVLYWQGFCNFRQQPGEMPLEWARLLAYPSPGQRMISRVLEFFPALEEFCLSPSGFARDQGRLNWNMAEDWCLERKGASVAYRIGLTAVDQLAFGLVCCGPLGLPQFRIYDLIWPCEPFSFSRHQKRLEQLVLRGRKAGYRLDWQDLHLTWRTPTRGCTAGWRHNPRGRGAVFFEFQKKFFTRKDVETFFSLSRSAAAALCQEWVRVGQCSRDSDSNVTQYQVL